MEDRVKSLLRNALCGNNELMNESITELGKLRASNYVPLFEVIRNALFYWEEPLIQKAAVFVLAKEMTGETALLRCEAMDGFWGHVAARLSEFLGCARVDEGVKRVFMDKFSHVISFARMNGRDTFQGVLLRDYAGHPELAHFYIRSIVLIINEAKSLAGFEVAHLREIVKAEEDNVGPGFIYAFQLYLVICRACANDREIISHLIPMFGKIPADGRERGLRILTDFCDDSSRLLLPIINPFVDFVASVMKERSLAGSTRRAAMWLLTTVASRLRDLVSNNSDLRRFLVECFLYVMREVPIGDMVLVDDDSQQLSPFVVAADCFEQMVESWPDVVEIRQVILGIMNEALSAEPVSWNTLFAILSAICRLRASVFVTNDSNDDPTWEVNAYYRVLRLITDVVFNVGSPLTIRAVGARALCNVYYMIRPNSAYDVDQERMMFIQGMVLRLLDTLYNEKNMVISSLLIKAVNKMLPFMTGSDELQRVRHLWVDGLSVANSDPKRTLLFLNGLSNLLLKRAICGDELLEVVTPFVMNPAQKSDIRIAALHAGALAARIKMRSTGCDASSRMGRDFMRVALDIRNHADDLGDSDTRLLLESMMTFLEMLRSGGAEFQSMLMPSLIKEVMKDVSVIRHADLSGDNDVVSESLMIKVGVGDGGEKLYVQKSDADDKGEMIKLMCLCMQWAFSSEKCMRDVVQCCEKLVACRYVIPSVEQEAWELFGVLASCKVGTDIPMKAVIMSYITHLRCNAGLHTICAATAAVTEALRGLTKMKCPISDVDVYLPILRKWTEHLKHVINIVAEDVVLCERLGSDSHTSVLDDSSQFDLEVFFGLLPSMLVVVPEITGTFFREEIAESLFALLGRRGVRGLAIRVFIDYVGAIGDYEKLESIWMAVETFAKDTSCPWYRMQVGIMRGLSVLFKRHAPEPAVAKKLYEMLMSLLDDISDGEDPYDALDSVFDECLLAISALLENSFVLFNTEEYAEQWYGYFKQIENPDLCRDVFSLLVNFLESGNAFFRDHRNLIPILRRLLGRESGWLRHADPRIARRLIDFAAIAFRDAILREYVTDKVVSRRTVHLISHGMSPSVIISSIGNDSDDDEEDGEEEDGEEEDMCERR